MTAKNKTIKLISTLLIVSTLLPTVLFSIPKKTIAQATAAMAVPTSDIPAETTGLLSKIYHSIATPSTVLNTSNSTQQLAYKILERILMTIAKSVLAKITQATINWINSGFHGSPLFVSNPASFFQDIAKSEVKRLVDMIGYNTFKFPFGPQTALNVISSYKSQLAYNAQYSLSRVINDPDLLVKYRNDFNFGGWNGFLVNTQYPQNNYIGFQGMIQQNLASRLEGTLVSPANKVKDALQQGMGFLSPQTCPSNPNYNNGVNEFLQPSYKPLPFDVNKYPGASGSLQWETENEIARGEWEENNTCPDGLVSTTPGSVVGNHIMDALGSNLRQTELGAALGNSLSAIFDALINHFLGSGLTALAGAVSPSAGADHWSYNGQTLSGGSTSITSGNATTITSELNIPQNVSVTTLQETYTNIYGGIAPYHITQSDASKAKVTALIDTSNSSGPRLTIVGLAPTTTPAPVTVYDSSTPVKTTTVSVTVNEIGALLANETSHTLPISVNINESQIVKISGGEGSYGVLTDADKTKAITTFDGATLVIIGVAQGSTSVVIADSSSSAKTVTINITINDPHALIVQQSVSASLNRTVYVPISGGTPPYTINRNMDPTVARAEIVNTNGSYSLAITGLVADSQTSVNPTTHQQTTITISHQTSVVIQDNSTPQQTTSIDISTSPFDPFIVSPQNVILGVGQTAMMTISNGLTPYSVVAQDTTSAGIATAEILSTSLSSLTITGKSEGHTQVTVKDASTTNPQTFLVDIDVTNLKSNPTSVSINAYSGRWGSGGSATATISGGTAPYKIITQPLSSVASAQFFPVGSNTLTINANSTGSTFVTVQDSSATHPQTLNIIITVN